MPFKSIKPKIKDPPTKYEFITDIINNKTQQRITTSGSSIPEGLKIHYFFKRWVKKINNREYKIPGIMYMLLHLPSKCTIELVIKELGAGFPKFAN